MNLRTLGLGLVAATGIGLLATGCKHKSIPAKEPVDIYYHKVENVMPGYKKIITHYIDGTSDTIHEVFAPVADKSGKVIDYTGPWHFKSLGDGQRYLNMYDDVIMSFNNVDSTMKAIASTAKRVR